MFLYLTEVLYKKSLERDFVGCDDYGGLGFHGINDFKFSFKYIPYSLSPLPWVRSPNFFF